MASHRRDAMPSATFVKNQPLAHATPSGPKLATIAPPPTVGASATSWATPEPANLTSGADIFSREDRIVSRMEGVDLRAEPEAMMDEPAIEVKAVKGLIDSAHHVKVKLADIQADVNSPLHSSKTFEELGLPENILKGVYASLKYNQPSKVQEKALPLLLSNPPQNMIAQSQSGTGKTAAFVLTMLCRTDPNLRETQALCLSPSRELARQTLDIVRQMGKFTTITSAAAIKETVPTAEHVTEQIIVGTPGTVQELQKQHLINLKHLKVLVFDEADVMLDKQGMGVQSIRLKRHCPENVQTLLFSATFKPGVMTFANKIVPNPNVLTLEREELSVDAINQFYIRCDGHKHKLQMLSTIYSLLTMSQSIIFVNSRDTAENVYAHMTLEDHRASILHGGMELRERDEIIDHFRQGVIKVLITTNVLARGIDIMQVSLVINFDIPVDADRRPDPETYLHRIGRTGRFGHSGVSINFVHDQHSYEQMMFIQQFFGKSITEISTHNLESLDEELRDVSNKC